MQVPEKPRDTFTARRSSGGVQNTDSRVSLITPIINLSVQHTILGDIVVVDE